MHVLSDVCLIAAKVERYIEPFQASALLQSRRVALLLGRISSSALHKYILYQQSGLKALTECCISDGMADLFLRKINAMEQEVSVRDVLSTISLKP